MPVISTEGWFVNVDGEEKVLTTSSFSLRVKVRFFTPPNERYCLVQPVERVPPDVWFKWLTVCKANAYFDPKCKVWVWTKLSLDRVTKLGYYVSKADLTDEQRKKIREERKKAEESFNQQLDVVSKLESVPENLWNTYNYPSHYNWKGTPPPPLPPAESETSKKTKGSRPEPTALQRIIVSRYWDKPASLFAASVGTGKSRMTVDILSARAVLTGTNDSNLRDSARIILVIAPLTLHENWKREFKKWSDVDFRCHIFQPNKKFWNNVEEDAAELFKEPDKTKQDSKPGGIVIITTPQAMGRKTLTEQFVDHNCIPTFIIIDEAQRFFRNKDNAAWRNLFPIRKLAHGIIALTGTPTSEFKDWYALEEMLGAGNGSFHWKEANFQDYERASDHETMNSSGLWEPGWNFDRLVKEYHYDRIKKGNIFVADKWFYMKDSLPGLEQMELGDFADTRLGFKELFDRFPDFVQAAYDLQKEKNPGSLDKISEGALANVLLTRMQQITAGGEPNFRLLESWVTDFLDGQGPTGEPAVIWTMFRDELAAVSNTLSQLYGPTGTILGDQKEKDRWDVIDGFQNGKLRFIVAQVQAGGVGVTLTRAKKCLFLSIPFSYLDITQAIGRLHRIGQKEDVTSYFAMTSPVAAFARAIYDRRAHLNEVIPQDISGVLTRLKK